ncbi:DUF2892 domain-containing protein [Lysobacter pythonis]|uniref:DUF2892 domain-containing protein n=1 Tax=Solilutibacter pythonis TaxID=2483112 RepID=A0A3M2HN80_9GAMM|nr:DUF2892 domain-containing protein [Lysobacter pythonis]RMH88382.1 DUF2892 domain-containing protein [Lysobacter pythonis]
MQANVGSVDRIIRIVIGLVVLSLLFVLPAPQKYFGLIGIVPILTAIIHFCPLYHLFGIDTCKAR